MKRLFFLGALTSLFTACQCGPGVACKADSDCGDWGHCSSVGFCVANGSSGGGTGGGSAGGGGGGAPNAVLAETHVDLMLAGCGTTNVTQMLQVLNTGGAPLNFTTSLGGSTDFQVSAGGTVAPMGSSTVTVTASPPSSQPANTTLMGTLVITTDDPSHPRFEVPLTEITQGVTLTLSPMLSSFGVVPVGTPSAPVPLTLTNVGNQKATVSFAAPSDLQFSLSWMGAPNATTIDVNQSAAGLQATFTPMSIMPSSTSAAISVAEPVCGQSASTILMTGQGTMGVVGISTTDVVFGDNGLVPCGTTAMKQTFVLSNGGNQGFSWSGTLGKGTSSPFTVSPSGGTVPAMMSTTIEVTASAIPQQASTAADAFGDVFTLTTDAANDTAHPITLHQTAQGAVLTFNPSAVDFGGVPVNTTAAAPFTLSNSGTGVAHVTLGTDNAAFTVSTTGATTLNPGDLPVTAHFAPGSLAGPQTGNVTISVPPSDVLCAPLPSMLPLSGTGTTGSVSYSPVALDFGLVNCGATAAPNSVTFSNAGNQDYTVTPALALGTAYSLSMSPDSGVVAQDGGTLVITVTPLPVPQTSLVTPNLYGDTLTVTTDVPMDVPHNIALRETAKGAIFDISSQALDFGTVPIGVAQPAQLTVTNNGNASGTLGFTVGTPQIFSLPSSVTVPGPGSKPVTATFAPTMAQTYSDTANLAAQSTVLCQPLPFTTMTLHGVGTNMNVMPVSPATLTFGTGGLTPCGSTAPAQTVTVTNNSSATLSLSYSLAADVDGGSPYMVTGPASVAMGQQAMVTVTPKAIPGTAATTADLFADTLTIKGTGGAVNESHTVALHQTAQGAILTFNPVSLAFSVGALSSGNENFTVNNAGNVNAPYSLTVGGAQASLYKVSPTSGTANANNSSAETATYSPGLDLGTTHATISISSSAGLCAPLPAPLAMTGN